MGIVLSFWNVLAMMAPWILVGFLLARAVSVLLPRKWVVGVMGRARGWRGEGRGRRTDARRGGCRVRVDEGRSLLLLPLP